MTKPVRRRYRELPPSRGSQLPAVHVASILTGLQRAARQREATSELHLLQLLSAWLNSVTALAAASERRLQRAGRCDRCGARLRLPEEPCELTRKLLRPEEEERS